MKTKMYISIKQRIYLSFFLLVGLFVLNGIITNVTLRDNKKLSERLSTIVDPSLKVLDDFKKMMLESKMYTTNWVFLRDKKEDKAHLEKLHDADYVAIKTQILSFTSRWRSRAWADSMDKVLTGFEELLVIEKEIMQSLRTFTDYDDPVLKLEAERKIEDEVLPRTDTLLHSLNRIGEEGLRLKGTENVKLEKSSSKLEVIITALAIAMICIGLFLSLYLAKVIIAPVKKINHIIDELGKGNLRKIDHQANGNEIGSMIRSVNNLSDSLQSTANFAHEIGLRNFDMPFEPLSDDDTLGKALIAMRQNLKMSDKNLEAQNKELETKNRELEQFAYVASHDLQEPLRTTASFVELLRKQYKGQIDEKADKYLDYIAGSSERMKVLISDLLEYSRIGSKKEWEPVDCNKVLSEVLEDIDTAIKETGINITSIPLPVINGYRTEIKLLFQNLLINTIKFRKKDIPAYANITVRKKGGAWEFAISDNGIGIAAEHFERIFIIFQRLHTRNEYSGSGIGLSHCKKIVESHKGKIWLESKLGKGTTFYFTIPQINKDDEHGKNIFHAKTQRKQSSKG